MIPLLWQDETAVAVLKPSGLLTHNSAWAGPRETSLRQLVSAQVGAPVQPVHRLDRAASGVVIFARDGRWVQPWHDRLGEDDSEKAYLALVRGRLAAAVVVDHPVKDERGVARAARSTIEPLAASEAERCGLVRVRLHTGRRHQARRHLHHVSHPVLGDTTYGQGAVNRHYRERWGLHRLALHAHRVALRHPLGDARVVVTAPVPEDLLAVLRALLPGVDAYLA